MCELPRRSWKSLVSPLRIVLALAALVALGVGNLGLVLVGAGLLLATVVLPTVQQLEFGFPVGLKVTAAVRDREAELRQELESQRGTYELCAQLLTEDPAVAARLLEAAWARTAAEWRRPVGPALRTYVLCVLVHLIIEEHHGGDTGPLWRPGARHAARRGPALLRGPDARTDLTAARAARGRGRDAAAVGRAGAHRATLGHRR